MKPGYWADHEYARESVVDIPRFCGWPTLVWLVKVAGTIQYRTDEADYLQRRDQALVAALFETGGRVREVLMLRKQNFKIEPNRILIQDMPLLKRYRKKKSYIERRKELPDNCTARLYEWDKKRKRWWRKRWETEPIFANRQDFTISLAEPLAYPLLSWIKQADKYLFPPRRKSKKTHLEDSRAYTILRGFVLSRDTEGNVKKRSESIETNFNRLVDEGLIPLNKVRLYDHWFRAMRAGQLVKDYKYREFRLKRFFGWEGSKMAFHYAHMGVEELEEAWVETEEMRKAKAIL